MSGSILETSQILTEQGIRQVVISFRTDKGPVRAANEDTGLVISSLESTTDSPGVNGIVVGIFDGHGGDRAARYCTSELGRKIIKKWSTNLEETLRSSLVEIDSEVLETTKWNDGTTALVAILSKATLTVANLGDCQGLIVYQPLTLEDLRSGRSCRKLPIISCHPHHIGTNSLEICRVTAAGGIIRNNRIWIVDECGKMMGGLTVSRSIGDRLFKQKCPVINIPETETIGLNGRELCIILASDGLWDVLNSDHVVDYVDRYYSTPEKLTRRLIELAYQKGSTDNVTVIAIIFNDFI